MLFTSSIFLYGFLPLVVVTFFLLARFQFLKFLVIPFLIFASFVFYGYKEPYNIALLLVSIITNYSLSRIIQTTSSQKDLFFWIGVAFNLVLLFYFKYLNFFLANISYIGVGEFELMDIALPLAISFYTFQQIAYLADSKYGWVTDTSIKSYFLFVTFFPQLIIGPIVHHKEMMPQFKHESFGKFSFDNLKSGFFYLYVGLCKKLFLADYCAKIVDSVHIDIASGGTVNFIDAWAAALAFSFQIYFDFSGYTDMAVGIALIFGIRLPFNFNSPYRASSVSEFWRRWHMTLSRWLRDYLYIPLGGNSRGPRRAMVNAIIVFLLGGLWHGAAWTFVVWGVLQGLGIAVSRFFASLKLPLPSVLAIALTFLFATLSWVLFRAENLDVANQLYLVMLGTSGFEMTAREVVNANVVILLVAALLSFFVPNTHQLVHKLVTLSAKLPKAALAGIMLVAWISLAAFDLDSSAEFIYFDF